MAQHLNLYDAARRRRRPPFGSSHLGTLLLAVLGLSLAASLGLHGLAVRERGLQRDDETELQALRLQGGRRGVPAERQAELDQLRSLEAARRQAQRVLALNRIGSAPAAGGHGAGYFEALSRRARADLWITAFSVSADGRQVELSGRMQQAGSLPAYLRSLNDEPLFRGRPFAQLEMRRAGHAGDTAEGGDGVVEFTLRSQAPREEPPR